MLTIRNASVQDISLIRNLSLKVWPQTYSRIISSQQISYMLDLMYSEKALQKQFEDHHRFIIIYNEAIPVGFASYSEITPNIYKLHKIYVLPDNQGRGTGKFVIDHIVNDIRTKGATSFLLNVNRNNPAKTFYEKIGFEVVGTDDIDIGGGFLMNDYVMSLKL